MDKTERFMVEVAHAAAPKAERGVFLKQVSLRFGQCVRDAIEASGALDECPGIDLEINRVGIHGRLCSLDDIPKAGDRIEIYRPLKADPKKLRRQAALQGDPA